jgi:hypothetical protein
MAFFDGNWRFSGILMGFHGIFPWDFAETATKTLKTVKLNWERIFQPPSRAVNVMLLEGNHQTWGL